MDIAITFDIEFDINGALEAPFERKPRGRDSLIVSNKGEDPGLGRILEYLRRYDLKATFFVEALQTAWFGFDEMGEIANTLHEQGHEVQLHLHPVWLIFDDPQWQNSVSKQAPRTATHDSLSAIPSESARKAIERGLEVFRQWGLPRPTAIRTGNLIVEMNLYRIFAECGLRISSSIGLGIHKPSSTELNLFSVSRSFDGVTEIPVTSFIGANPLLLRQLKLATIIGTGKSELRSLLESGVEHHIPFLVLLSHVSEFSRPDDSGFAVENRLTAGKFSSLCSTISSSDSINPVTIDELAKKHGHLQRDDIKIHVPRLKSVSRFIDRPDRPNVESHQN